jgi:hypothetical protein
MRNPAAMLAAGLGLAVLTGLVRLLHGGGAVVQACACVGIGELACGLGAGNIVIAGAGLAILAAAGSSLFRRAR